MRLATSLSSVFLLVLVSQTVVVSSQRKNAALIVGGYWYDTNVTTAIINHVELFGCEGHPSVTLGEFPNGCYLPAGARLPDQEKVIACGGYSCTPESCTTVSDCFIWDSADGSWTRGPSLMANRFNYIMPLAVNTQKPEQGMVPLAIGNGRQTEIYDKVAGAWGAHTPLTDADWYSLACFVSYNDKIYSLRDRVIELDPATWVRRDLAVIPNQLVRSGMCAGLTINGRAGIYTRFGYWYDLEANTWTQKAPPPVVALSGLTNAMWSFNGRPTIFGNPICNDEGGCENKLVHQYNPETDAWEELGEMLYSRTYQMVVEVPGEYCENFGAGLPSAGSYSRQSFGMIGVSAVLTMLLRH